MGEEVNSFGYLGKEFQLKLISQIITDKKFGLGIIDEINPQYFDNQNFRQLVALIKDYNQKYSNSLPSFGTLKELVLLETKEDFGREYLLTVIKEAHEKENTDTEFVQDTTRKFCQQQELKKYAQNVLKTIEKGDYHNIDDFQLQLNKIISIGSDRDDGQSVFTNIESCLDDDFRKPIPTGIHGLDEQIGGGLGKCELGMIIAPMGTGKTSLLTKIANTAFDNNKIVLQIVFEDTEQIIQRKHIACWSGIELNELQNNKAAALETVNQKMNASTGELIIKRFASDSTNVNHIKQTLRSLRNQGKIVDMLVIDYIDCIVPVKTSEDPNANEGNIVRSIESMAHEYDIAIWTALQGNRSSISAEVVEMHQMGGSIKRGQVAHLVISLAKTLEQKEKSLATMAILKSRFGGDGKVFNNMTFDNGRLFFDTTECQEVSQLGYETQKKNEVAANEVNRVQKALERFKDAENKVKENKSVHLVQSVGSAASSGLSPSVEFNS